MNETSANLYRRRSDVLAESVHGETVLLDLEAGLYLSLNPVASRVWTLLGEGLNEHRIVERLLLEYDVEQDKLHSDIRHLIDELVERKLLCAAA